MKNSKNKKSKLAHAIFVNNCATNYYVFICENVTPTLCLVFQQYLLNNNKPTSLVKFVVNLSQLWQILIKMLEGSSVRLDPQNQGNHVEVLRRLILTDILNCHLHVLQNIYFLCKMLSYLFSRLILKAA